MKYSITDFLEKRKEMPFEDLMKSIKRANDMYDSDFLHTKFKTKDEEYFARHYFKILDSIIEFVNNDYIIDTKLYSSKTIQAFKPILEEYVRRGEVPEYSLKEFE